MNLFRFNETTSYVSHNVLHTRKSWNLSLIGYSSTPNLDPEHSACGRSLQSLRSECNVSFPRAELDRNYTRDRNRRKGWGRNIYWCEKSFPLWTYELEVRMLVSLFQQELDDVVWEGKPVLQAAHIHISTKQSEIEIVLCALDEALMSKAIWILLTSFFRVNVKF